MHDRGARIDKNPHNILRVPYNCYMNPFFSINANRITIISCVGANIYFHNLGTCFIFDSISYGTMHPVNVITYDIIFLSYRLLNTATLRTWERNPLLTVVCLTNTWGDISSLIVPELNYECGPRFDVLGLWLFDNSRFTHIFYDTHGIGFKNSMMFLNDLAMWDNTPLSEPILTDVQCHNMSLSLNIFKVIQHHVTSYIWTCVPALPAHPPICCWPSPYGDCFRLCDYCSHQCTCWWSSTVLCYGTCIIRAKSGYHHVKHCIEINLCPVPRNELTVLIIWNTKM